MIALREVTKRFGATLALDSVSLDVPPGATHVLLGSSGSGKSTVLRLILGLAAPDAGTVVVDGVTVDAGSRDRLVARMGYVVQDGGLYPHLTAVDNVTLAADAQGWPRGRIAARVAELAGMAGLDAATLGRYPRELSGGQRQRVGLMRALMLDPPVLLLDEPLGALDPIVRAELQDQLGRLFATPRQDRGAGDPRHPRGGAARPDHHPDDRGPRRPARHLRGPGRAAGRSVRDPVPHRPDAGHPGRAGPLSDAGSRAARWPCSRPSCRPARAAEGVIRVGSKSFTESYILAEVVAQVIEQAGEARAERRVGLGGTGLTQRALESGGHRRLSRVHRARSPASS